MKQVLNFITEYWDVLAPLIYEIIARIVPTKRNFSLIDNGWKILNLIITNRRKPSPDDIVVPQEPWEKYEIKPEQNKIQIPRNKHILHSLLILIAFTWSGGVFAQTPTTTQSRGLFIYNASDTAVLKNIRAALQTSTGNTGGLYFDKTRNKWRIWIGTCAACPVDSAWIDLTSIGNSGAFWPLSGTGVLSAPVTIDGGQTVAFNFGNWQTSINGDWLHSSTGDVSITGTNSFTITNGNAAGITGNANDVQVISNNGTASVVSGADSVYLAGSNGAMIFGTGNSLLRLAPNLNTYLYSDNDLFLRAFTGNIISQKQHRFTPTITSAPVKLGSLAGIPSGIGESDIGYDGLVDGYYGNTTAGNHYFNYTLTTELVVNRLPFFTGNNGRTSSSSNLTFTGTNTLNAPIGNFTTSISSPIGTFSTSLRPSYMTSTQLSYFDGTSLVGDADLTFTGGNQLNAFRGYFGGATQGIFVIDNAVSGIGGSTATNFVAGTGTSGQNNGGSITISGGSAYSVSGNGNGGNIIIQPGINRGSGTEGVTSIIDPSSSTNVIITSTTAGISPVSNGIKHQRVTTGTVTGGGGASLVTLTWSTVFTDNNYTATAFVEESSTSVVGLQAIRITSKTANNITVLVSNTAVGDLTGTLHVTAFHD